MLDCPKEVYITSGTSVVGADTSHQMAECDHEEADTRLLIHLQDALENGSTTCQVRTVDTDVIVIFIGKLKHLLTLNPEADICVAFGTGKHFSHFHISGICTSLGNDRSLALPVFHSFMGCDTTSAFFEKGKKLAWGASNSYPDVTQAFTYIARNPFAPVDEESSHFKHLERYFIVLYDKTCNLESISEARRSCSAIRTRQWNIFHQPRMPFCNTQSVLYTRLVFGPPVNCHSNVHHRQRDGGGHWKTNHGLPFGSPFQCPRKPAVNL